MMMMVILTSNKLRLSAVQLLYSKTVLTESACRCLFDTFCRYRLVLVGRARLAWASIWVPINRSEPSLHLGLLLPYQVCISLLLLFTLMIMHSSRGVTSYLNCCMPHRRGGGLPARLTGNVSRHLYDSLFGPTSPRYLNSLKTATPICLTIFGTTPHHVLHHLLPDKNDYTYNLRPSPAFFLVNFQDWSSQFC